MVRIAKNLWPLHLLVQTLDRWVVLDKSVAPFDEIPAEVQEEIKAELLKWIVSGEDTIAYSSESSYAANLEMATNEYKPSNRVVAEEEVTRVANARMLNQLMKLQPSSTFQKNKRLKLFSTWRMVSLLQPF